MATIDDVAREAGVAISTVSYALSGKRKVSAETRARIEAACVALDYAPRASARALAANHSDIIAVTAPLHPDTDPAAHMAFAMEVTIGARRHDYDTLLLVHDDALQGMRRSATTALADGIIVLDVAAHDDRAALARKLNCPVVFIGLPEDHADLYCVDLDFEAAVQTAVDTLVDAGHQRIALISHSQVTMARESNFPLRVVHEFERYASERGLQHAVGYPAAYDADEVVGRLLEEMPGLTAIVLNTTNPVAQSLMAALTRRGLSVPGDISVIAAGMTPLMSRTPLPFDTLPLDPALTCPVAVDILVDLIAGIAPARGATLVSPLYQSHGSVAPASAPVNPQAR